MLQVLLLVTLATAQVPVPTRPPVPEGWQVRLDDVSMQAGKAPATAAAGVVDFVVMKPGWHVTTGPSAILYQSASQASGLYSVKAETFLFDPKTRNEAYGVLIGGRNLEGADQAYTYFVIRRSGEFLIKRRAGPTTTNVRDWTAHTAIRKWDERSADERSVRNILEVQVAADSAAFLVNGQEVARVPTRDIDTNGVVGLRINHHLNLHVSGLAIGT